jgi:hypothetical protein
MCAVTLLLIALLGLLSGCQTNATRSPYATRGSIPAGSSIQLLKPLTIPAKDNQVFIQDGQATSSSGYNYGYDQYYPFCFFKTHRISKKPQTIHADSFTIQRVYYYETEFVQTKPVRVASLIPVTWIASETYVSPIVLLTVMELSSDKQPFVKKLVCGGGYDLPQFAKLPTIQQIHGVLGELGNLIISRE